MKRAFLLTLAALAVPVSAVATVPPGEPQPSPATLAAIADCLAKSDANVLPAQMATTGGTVALAACEGALDLLRKDGPGRNTLGDVESSIAYRNVLLSMANLQVDTDTYDSTAQSKLTSDLTANATEITTLIGGQLPVAPAAAPPGTTVPPPITYTGHGDYVVELGANDRFVAHFTHSGRGNFVVEALDATTDSVQLVVNEIGRYDGTVGLMPRGGASYTDVKYLKIQADGDWTVDMIDAKALLRVDSKFGAHGSYVVVYTGPGGIYDITHNGASNFVVRVITSDTSDLLVNEIGTYSGRTILPPGLAIVFVEGDGDWTFTPAA